MSRKKIALFRAGAWVIARLPAGWRRRLAWWAAEALARRAQKKLIAEIESGTYE